MSSDNRTQPPYHGNEKDTLVAFLNYLRETIIIKCSDLTEEQLRSTPTVSSISLLGMLKHLTIVERYWFQGVFMDADVDLPWSEEDPDGDWRAHESDTVVTAIQAYADECALSDQIVLGHDLEEPAAWAESDEDRRSLRWIMVHMIEETGRHCGHADIIREAIDGVTGE